MQSGTNKFTTKIAEFFIPLIPADLGVSDVRAAISTAPAAAGCFAFVETYAPSAAAFVR
jgi:hypothetical protein